MDGVEPGVSEGFCWLKLHTIRPTNLGCRAVYWLSIGNDKSRP